MNRRKLLTALFALPVVAAIVPQRLSAWVKPKHTFNESEVIFMAGSMLLTKLEITSAIDLNGLLRAKAENFKQSFLRRAAEEIERRQWGVVEYAINTTEKQ